MNRIRLLPLRIAKRYLLSRKSHSAVNVISAISVAAIAVAVAAMVVVLSVFNGFADVARAHLSMLDPDITILPARGHVIGEADSLAAEIGERANVAAAAVTLEQRGLLVNADRQCAVVFKGVPEEYGAVVDTDPAVVAATSYSGAYSPDGTGLTDVAVGVANTLELIPGMGGVTLYVPRRVGRVNPANPATAFLSAPLTTGDVFQVDQLEVDADHIYVPLETARELLMYEGGEGSAIEVRAADGAKADALAADLQKALGSDYRVLPREELHAASLMMVSVEKWVTFAMLGFILIIASFNIISTLSLLVIEKRHNMTTLGYLGAPTGMLREVFMWIGALITMAGAVCGIALGTLLTLAQQIGGFIHLSGDPSQLTVDVYPVRLWAVDLAAVFGVSIIIAALASLATRLFTRKFE